MTRTTTGRGGFDAPFVLAIDVGSSSVKAALFDSRARMLDHTAVRVAHRIHPTHDGGVEEVPDHLVSNVEEAVDGVMRRAGAESELVAAVGMDTMASTVMGVDGRGRAVTPIYTYADTRPQQDVDAIKGSIDEEMVHQRTGCVQHPSYLPGRFLWLRRTDPETARSVITWMDPGTYLYRRWFGADHVAASYSIASWTGMLDRHQLKWDGEMLRLTGLEESSLPPLADYTHAMSGLARPFAARWPTLSDVPFFLALGDGASANVGSGCVSPDSVALTIGTSGALRVLTAEASPPVPPGLWAYRLSKATLLGGALSDGGSVVEWARSTLRLPDDQAELDRVLLGMEPVAHGLAALPFLSGERSPGWFGDATAAFAGLRVTSTAEQMLQALLEATAYRFAKVWELLRPHAADDASIIASGGAINRTRYWPQLVADVLARDVVQCVEPEATSRGTAVLALRAAGLWQSLSDVGPELGNTYHPDPERVRIYQDGQKSHDKLYDVLVRRDISWYK